MRSWVALVLLAGLAGGVAGQATGGSVGDGRVSKGSGKFKIRSITVYDPTTRITLSWNDSGTGPKQVTANRLPATSAVGLGGGGALAMVPPVLRDAPPDQTMKQPETHGDELIAETHTEKLGQKAIPGVIAEGTRVTTKYSAGSKVAGNVKAEELDKQ